MDLFYHKRCIAGYPRQSAGSYADGSNCSLCGESSRKCLFKCIDHGCNMTLCNRKPLEHIQGSHIYQHLSVYHHNVISANSELSSYGELACTECSNRNIFSLGILKKTGKIVCRNPCLFRYEPSKKHWKDIKSWVPIVHERALRFMDFKFSGSPKMPIKLSKCDSP